MEKVNSALSLYVPASNLTDELENDSMLKLIDELIECGLAVKDLENQRRDLIRICSNRFEHDARVGYCGKNPVVTEFSPETKRSLGVLTRIRPLTMMDVCSLPVYSGPYSIPIGRQLMINYIGPILLGPDLKEFYLSKGIVTNGPYYIPIKERHSNVFVVYKDALPQPVHGEQMLAPLLEDKIGSFIRLTYIGVDARFYLSFLPSDGSILWLSYEAVQTTYGLSS